MSIPKPNNYTVQVERFGTAVNRWFWKADIRIPVSDPLGRRPPSTITRHFNGFAFTEARAIKKADKAVQKHLKKEKVKNDSRRVIEVYDGE